MHRTNKIAGSVLRLVLHKTREIRVSRMALSRILAPDCLMWTTEHRSCAVIRNYQPAVPFDATATDIRHVPQKADFVQ